MPILSRVIGLHIVGLGVLWIVWAGSGGNIGMYLDVPSLLLVGLLLFGCSLICFTPGELIDAVRAVAQGPSDASGKQRRRRVAVTTHAYQVAWGAGIVGTFLGLIAMLADLSDPSSIGAGMAVALISTLYGALLAEFVIAPLRQVLLNQLDPGDDPDEASTAPPAAAGGAGLWRGAAVVLLMVSCFFVLVVGFSEVVESERYDRTADKVGETLHPESDLVSD